MAPSPPVLRIYSAVVGEGERVFVLGDRPISIGRAEDCDIVLLEQSASRHHARIEPAPEGFVLTDLESGTGVLVDGHAVQRHILRDGETVKIGDTTLQLVVAPQSQSTLTGADKEEEPEKGLFSDIVPPPTSTGTAPGVPFGLALTDPAGAAVPPASPPLAAAATDPAPSSGTELAPPRPSSDSMPPSTPPLEPVAATPAVPEQPPVAVALSTPVPSVDAPTVPPRQVPVAPPTATPVPVPNSAASVYVFGHEGGGIGAPGAGAMTPRASGPSAYQLGQDSMPIFAGPVTRSSPSAYELGDAARVPASGAGPNMLDAPDRFPDKPAYRPEPSGGLGPGVWIAVFVLGLALAFGVSVLLYGPP